LHLREISDLKVRIFQKYEANYYDSVSRLQTAGRGLTSRLQP